MGRIGMVKVPKEKPQEPEGDPKRGDEILKRMLQSKPKPHKQMKKGRKSERKGQTK